MKRRHGESRKLKAQRRRPRSEILRRPLLFGGELAGTAPEFRQDVPSYGQFAPEVVNTLSVPGS